MAVLRVLSIHGDDAFEYDPAVEDGRSTRARAVFDETLKRGYLAFVPQGDSAGTQIRQFDPKAREIILQPPISGG